MLRWLKVSDAAAKIGDLGEPRLFGRREASGVGYQRGVARRRAPRDAACDLCCIAHLRDARRVDERRDLDHRQPRRRQGVDKRDLCRGRDLRRFVLQSVARAYLDDGHSAWQRRPGHDISTNGTPGCTRSPTWQATLTTTPSVGDFNGSSIFIASSTTRVSPRDTRSPGFDVYGADSGRHWRGQAAGQIGRAHAGRPLGVGDLWPVHHAVDPDPRRVVGASREHTVSDAVDEDTPLSAAHRFDLHRHA